MSQVFFMMLGLFAGFYLGMIREAKSERREACMILEEALIAPVEFDVVKLAKLGYNPLIQSCVQAYVMRSKGAVDPREDNKYIVSDYGEWIKKNTFDIHEIIDEINKLNSDRWKFWKI